MNKFIASVLFAGFPAVAAAGGQAGTLGVGVEYEMTNQIGGISANYDAGNFHVGGSLGMTDPAGSDNTSLYLGGRFYYHLHATASADFGVGGNLGIGLLPGDSTALLIAPGFQVRGFLTPNVALSATAGITIFAADVEGLYVGGQPMGSFGLHYYFF